MDYNKYIKYKKKYLLEKIKMIGGEISRCLFVDAHGSEIPDKTIKLDETRMVIMYYKPFCDLYAENIMKNELNRTIKITKCHNSNYITLNSIFFYYSRDIADLEKFSVHTGKKKDVNFFDTIYDDGNVYKNNISKIPDIDFTFKEKTFKANAYSFPVSDDPKNKEAFYQYVINYPNENYKKPEGLDIYYKDSGSIKLSECLNTGFFDFAWIVSCRSMENFDYLHNPKIKKRIGIPIYIFILYSFYRIIVHIFKIEDEIANIEEIFYKENKDLFGSKEYSHDNIGFIGKFRNILINTLISLMKIKSISIPKSNKNYTLQKLIHKILLYVIVNKEFYTLENSFALDTISKNARSIEIFYFNGSRRISSSICTYKTLEEGIYIYMYVLSFLVNREVNYFDIMGPLLRMYNACSISEIPNTFMNYEKIKDLKLNDVKKIKISEFYKKEIYRQYDLVRGLIDKMCDKIKELSKHYYDIVRKYNTLKLRYKINVVYIPLNLDKFILVSKDDFDIKIFYEYIHENIIDLLLTVITENLSSYIHLIEDIRKSQYINVLDTLEMITVNVETENIKNGINKMLEKREKEIAYLFYAEDKNEILEDSNFIKLINDIIFIDDILIENFIDNDINIIHR